MTDSPKTYMEKLFEWAKTLDAWQKDAFRRLYQGEINQSDDDEILILLKEHAGIEVPEHPDAVSLPENLTEAEETSELPPLRLHAIRKLQNVNRVRNGEGIEFRPTGMTIIYGDNGSGKSGYGRVFKKACHARHAPKVILPNLYERAAVGPASAEFSIQEGESEPAAVPWDVNSAPLPQLLRIAIFDKACARIQTTKANDVSFLAYGQDIIERLVLLYERLSERIKDEVNGLPKLPDALTKLDEKSECGQWLKRLHKNTTEAEISSFAVLSPEERTKYKELEAKVSEHKRDPKKRSDEFRRKAGRTSALRSKLQTIADKLGDNAVAELKKLNEEHLNASKAAKATSALKFSEEPIPNIGSDTWKRMYLAAKEFAVKEAYPDVTAYLDTFDKRCVLCLQPLQPEAKERMERFEQFICDTTAKQLAQVRKRVEKAISELKTLDTKAIEAGSELDNELKEQDSRALDEAKELLRIADDLRQKVLIGLSNLAWPEIKGVRHPAKLVSKLDERSQMLIKLSEAALKEQPTEDEKKDETQLKALKDLGLLAEHTEAIKAFVKGLALADKLQKGLNALDTTSLTMKQTALLKESVTKKLSDALKLELKSLGVTHIVPKFKPSGTKGKLAQSIILDGLKVRKKGTLQDILSEGEESVIAIAAFLAELDLAPKFSVLVFDDPVSSLDHKWRDNVARRLAKLSAERQVIVFTHDLAFVFSLLDWMKRLGFEKHCAVKAIETRGKETGLLVPEGGEPLETLNVKKRIKRLNKRMQDVRTLYNEEGDSEAYREDVKSLYSLLRRTWERAVEEELFGGVILRFRDSINTQNLKDVATTIEPDDCRIIIEAMDKCSGLTDAHDSATRPAIPNPDELKNDIEQLSTFVESIRERRIQGNSTQQEVSDASGSPA